MANTYFQFKQFLINQKKSGMKVTTDGCLFGAWVADQIKGAPPKRVLDIGAGTGLLSLMLAQATQSSQIDALEINENAFTEATDNFNISKWNDRLTCIHSSLQEHQSTEKYNLIICNPPFFANNPKGDKANKNQALHSDSLSAEELMGGIADLMKSTGKAYVLYPEREMNQFILEAEKSDLILNSLTIVRNRKADRVFRMMGEFSFQKSDIAKQEIIIREADRSYTKEFWSLVEEYYL
jgi:tRNA1Val (adenine37-N6)-methyltransferase